MLELSNSWYSAYLEKLSSVEVLALVIVAVVLGAGFITLARWQWIVAVLLVLCVIGYIWTLK
jgi:hypothetical protein